MTHWCGLHKYEKTPQIPLYWCSTSRRNAAKHSCFVVQWDTFACLLSQPSLTFFIFLFFFLHLCVKFPDWPTTSRTFWTARPAFVFVSGTSQKLLWSHFRLGFGFCIHHDSSVCAQCGWCVTSSFGNEFWMFLQHRRNSQNESTRNSRKLKNLHVANEPQCSLHNEDLMQNDRIS